MRDKISTFNTVHSRLKFQKKEVGDGN